MSARDLIDRIVRAAGYRVVHRDELSQLRLARSQLNVHHKLMLSMRYQLHMPRRTVDDATLAALDDMIETTRESGNVPNRFR